MWSVTPYARCDLRCHYCCTLVQGDSLPTKESPEEIVEQILRYPAGDTIILGAFSDAYPKAEARYKITREILLLLEKASRPIVIVTKGTTIIRDLDILKAMGENVLVQISVASLDDATSRKMEPGVAPASERISMLLQLHREGVPVEVNALPWIPDVSNLEELLQLIPADVLVNVSPLSTPVYSDQRRLLGRIFKDKDVIQRYLAERDRIGPHPQLSWVRPAETGQHDPMNRLKATTTASKGEIVRVY